MKMAARFFAQPSRSFLWNRGRHGIGPLFLAWAICCTWAQANTPTEPIKGTGDKSKPGTNAAAKPAPADPADAPLPQSTFVMPKGPTEGRDPFFPRSVRPYMVLNPNPQPVAPTNAPPPVAEIRLNGISGTSERPLAIINNVTFEKGEERDMVTPTGRFRVRCLEIRAESVLVSVGGDKKELKLRGGL